MYVNMSGAMASKDYITCEVLKKCSPLFTAQKPERKKLLLTIMILSYAHIKV